MLACFLCLSLCSCSFFRTAETESLNTETDPPESSHEDSTAVTEETDFFTTDDITEKLPVIPTRDPDAPGTICIDAGHGYVDPGCTTDYLNGLYERDIVAEYADELKVILEGMGYRVILLRDDDKYITAEEISAAADDLGMDYMKDKLVDDQRFAPYNRCVWANVLHRETYIDLFISLHIDSYDSMQSVRGTRIYYCSENPYSVASQNMCTAIKDALAKNLPDQNPRTFPKSFADAFVVTKHTEMPSALIEMGFATNKTDAENLLDKEWRDTFLNSVAEGVKNYLGY